MNDNFGCFGFVILAIVLGICMFLTYVIATSELPLWLKFLLLR